MKFRSCGAAKGACTDVIAQRGGGIVEGDEGDRSTMGWGAERGHMCPAECVCE